MGLQFEKLKFLKVICIAEKFGAIKNKRSSISKYIDLSYEGDSRDTVAELVITKIVSISS